MKYYVTIKVDARYIARVDADDVESAKGKALEAFQEADFGDAEDIDGEATVVEDADGNYVWDKA